METLLDQSIETMPQDEVDAKFEDIVEAIERDVNPEELKEVATPHMKPNGYQDQGWMHN